MKLRIRMDQRGSCDIGGTTRLGLDTIPKREHRRGFDFYEGCWWGSGMVVWSTEIIWREAVAVVVCGRRAYGAE